MVFQFVTLDQAKAHLRIDNDADDNDLLLKIQGASGAVMNYLKAGFPYEAEIDSNGDYILDSNGDRIPVLDSAGDPVVLPEVVSATLLMLGYLYKDRDADSEGAYALGYLPKAVMALLYPLRDPALA